MLRTAQAAILSLTLAACTFDSTLPPGAQVSCADGGACPAGLVCQRTLSLCVPPAALDETPPAIATSMATVVPRLGNRLSAPTALGPASEVVVSFSVTEVLGPLPSVTAWADGQPEPRVVCGFNTLTPPAFRVICQTSATSGPDATLTWQVALEDLVGNRATVVLEHPVRLDVTPPPPPSTDDGGIWLRDSPWGDEFTDYVPRTEFQSRAGVVRDAVRVGFRQGTSQLGDVAVGPAGDFAAFSVLASTSSMVPTIIAIDAAGNESDEAPIREVHWVASLVGKIAGRSYPNPHRLEVVRATAEGLEGFPVSERGAIDGLDRPGGARVAVDGAGTWRRFGFQSPNGAVLGAAAYDPNRSRVVRFGGNTGGTARTASGVWEWSGADWQRRLTIDPEGDGDPAGRLVPMLTWDPQRRGIVMSGGVTATGPMVDTWLWNGTSWKRLPDAPDTRIFAVMTFDPALDTMVVSAGLDSAGNAVTSARRLDTDGWVYLDGGAPFGPRVGATVASEPLTGSNLLFGGNSDSSLWINLGDQWVLFDAGVPFPEPRVFAASTWDPLTSRFLISGGRTLAGAPLADLWAFDSNSNRWVELTPDGGVGPGARENHSLISDPARAQVLLFGRTDDGGAVADGDNDTWSFDGRSWRLANQPSPPPTVIASPALLPLPGTSSFQTLGFNPNAPPTNVALGTSGWTQAPTTLLAELIGWLAWDPVQQRAWVLGLFSGRTPSLAAQELDGGWNVIGSIPGLDPDAVTGFVATPGGFEVLEAAPDGGLLALRTLSRSAALGPRRELDPPLRYAVMTATGDPQRGIAIVGIEAVGDRPRLFFSATSNPTPPDFDPTGLPNGMVSHRARNSLVVPAVYPGFAVGALPEADLWEFKDQRWSRLPAVDVSGSGLPAFEVQPALGYSPDTERIVAVQRSVAYEPIATWHLDIGRERPQVMLRFFTGELPQRLSLLGASLRVTAGGSSTDPASVSGVEIAMRSPGWWPSAGTLTTASAASPQTVTIPLPDDALVGVAALLRRNGELDVRLQPIAPNGVGLSRLVVDAPVLELRYLR